VNWDAIGAVGELVSAAAVLVTLIYLAIQVRHSRRAQEAEAIRTNRQERRDYFSQMRDSPYMPVIFARLEAGEPLTREEELRLMHHNGAAWGLHYSEWIQRRLGSYGEFGTSQDATLRVLLDAPGALDFFDAHGRDIYPAAFVADVNRLRAEAGLQ